MLDGSVRVVDGELMDECAFGIEAWASDCGDADDGGCVHLGSSLSSSASRSALSSLSRASVDRLLRGFSIVSSFLS